MRQISETQGAIISRNSERIDFEKAQAASVICQGSEPKRAMVPWYQCLTRPKGEKPGSRDKSSLMGNGQSWRRGGSSIMLVVDGGAQ